MYEFVTCLSWDYCVDGELDITLYDIEVRLRGWAKLMFLFFYVRNACAPNSATEFNSVCP